MPSRCRHYTRPFIWAVFCCFLCGLASTASLQTPPPSLPPAKFNSFKRAGASEENLSPVLLPQSSTCLDHRRWNGGHRSETTVADAAPCFWRYICASSKFRTQRKRGGQARLAEHSRAAFKMLRRFDSRGEGRDQRAH